jgi:ABC-type multidrug transport system fused ATPase/permease subunit
VIAFNAAYRVRKLIAFVTIVMFTIAASFMISGEFLMAWWASQSESTYATDLIAVVGLSWLVWNLASFTWTRNNFRESANDLRSLLRNWMTAQDMAMGLRRVFDILDIDPEITNRDDAIPMTGFRREIRFENVSFSYEAKRPVLEDVTFSATPGSISALIGPTGSGKSTLMALLLRLFDPAAGSISIDGIDLRNYQIESLRRHIAIALQENVLFGMSVRENIRYVAPEASDAQVSEAVRIADMSDYVSGLPHGLDTVLSDRGGKLSTGQRQRLSIARAVVRDTPILVLDEPTAALDAATEHRVMGNLSEWGSSQGRAIFVITHRISTIRRAENILYLDSGRILESGSHEALMQIENGRYRGFVETESSLQNIQSPS